MQQVRELQSWVILARGLYLLGSLYLLLDTIITSIACLLGIVATPALGEDQGGADQQAQHWEQLRGNFEIGLSLGKGENKTHTDSQSRRMELTTSVKEKH